MGKRDAITKKRDAVVTDFNWKLVESPEYNISKVVKAYECSDTNIVAYIIDKDDINLDYEYGDGLYAPLCNNYGVYFLYGQYDDKGRPKVYSGQATRRKSSRGMTRLHEHKTSDTEVYRNDWDKAVFFTSVDDSWSTAVLDSLEATFIELLTKSDKAVKLNSMPGTDGNIPLQDFWTKLKVIVEFMCSGRCNLFELKEVSDYFSRNKDKATDDAVAIYEKALKEVDEEVRKNLTESDYIFLTKAKQYQRYRDTITKVRDANAFIFADRIYKRSGGMVEVITPYKTAKDMVNLIPDDSFDAKSKFLVLPSKDGVYLKCLLDRFMSSENLPISKFPFSDNLEKLKHIVSNQLYAICMSEEGYIISICNFVKAIEDYVNIYGGNTIDINTGYYVLPNIIYDKDLVGKAKANNLQAVANSFKTADKGESEDMKFDVVIGNPPYNSDLYLYFVDGGKHLSRKYTCMITPAKWQAKGGKLNDSFRKNIVPYMSQVVLYPNAREIFDVAEIDGVCYYLIDCKTHTTKRIINKCKCAPAFNNSMDREICGVMNNAAFEIIQKLLDYPKIKLNWASNHFGITDAKSGELLVYSNGKYSSRCGLGNISKNTQDIDKFKVTSNEMLGYAFFFDTDGKIIGSPSYTLLEPGVVCTSHYCVYRTYSNEEEAQSLISYLNTKLIRFVSAVTLTGTTTSKPEFWRFVPEMPSSEAGHIYTDDDVYKIFNISKEHIELIESIIKDRE